MWGVGVENAKINQPEVNLTIKKMICYCLQDEDDKPKSNDSSIFENGFASEEEFEQFDGLSIAEMNKLKNKHKNKV